MRVSLQEWNAFIDERPNAHLLQSGDWGELKSAFGWKAIRVINNESGAQILVRRLPLGFSIAYIPKGPAKIGDSLLSEIDKICQEEKAIFLKMEPDIWEPSSIQEGYQKPGWITSRPIQPQRTVMVPLSGSLDDLLASMKQKTRYNIRLAEKKGIVVKESDDLQSFHELSLLTAKRDAFGVHSLAYYQRAMDLFSAKGQCALLLATYDNKPVAGLMVFARGETAWYMYGASSDEERNRMPTYLIQWVAMQWAKTKGCIQYDLWGIPDVEEATLEDEFATKNSHDGLWGVYRFKRGFGGQVMRSVGAWDRVYQPLLYRIYKTVMRLQGRDAE